MYTIRAERPTSDDDYRPLHILCVSPPNGGVGFTLCLWLYISRSPGALATIIEQICTDDGGDRKAPFLRSNGDGSLSLFPVFSVHEEAEGIMDSSSNLEELPLSSVGRVELPHLKWVHIGCEVTRDYVGLHVGGVIVGVKFLSHASAAVSKENSYQKLTLVGYNKKDEKLQGFFHHVRVLPRFSSINDHRVESPPYELSVDTSFSENQDIEEDGDGVWSVVGGKASCRRNFSLDVVLIDALGRTVKKDMEVIASLVYADDREPVEKENDDSEALFLLSSDGFEFPSNDRPVKLINGRASFKLKVSQLSSRCDNRLFRIRFSIFGNQSYPFFKTYSRSIRSISENRDTRSPSSMGKKDGFAKNTFAGSCPSDLNELAHDIWPAKIFDNGRMTDQGVIIGCSLKRIKIGHDKMSTRVYADYIARCPDEAIHMDEKGAKFARLSYQPLYLEDLLAKKNTIATQISDTTIFKYCLGGIQERAVLLKDLATSADDSDMLNFAQQASLYVGCSHHCDQILLTRKLIQEGEDTWRSISSGGHQVLWEIASEEIERNFLKITRSSRTLSKEDLELLHKMAGTRDCIGREDFDIIWNWIYPVACSLSRYEMNELWECTSPKWIEGMITKEEAEASLASPCGLQAPGTFVLRFPTSRSWPHPDSGSLVVTYVGHDFAIHHKLISLGGKRMAAPKRLQELLFAEPELTRLGRVTR